MSADLDEEDVEELDSDAALAVADPKEYAQNQRLRAIYNKREEAYKAVRELPGWAANEEHMLAYYNAGHVVSAYALDLLELERRTDASIEIDEAWREGFRKKYPNGVRSFALFGGSECPKDSDDGWGEPRPLSCRLVLAACDEFIAKVGLAGHLDPGGSEDSGFDYSDLLDEGPPAGSVPDIEQATTD